jgi:hypothetical protein
MEAMIKLRSELPQDTQDILIKHEEDGTIDTAPVGKSEPFK